jgi:hypothetical protein
MKDSGVIAEAGAEALTQSVDEFEFASRHR